MTSPTFCKQLDTIEAKLPPLAANILKFNRALVARTASEMATVGELVRESASSMVSASAVGVRTVTGTARWAAERTAQVGTTGARQTIGQAKAQAKIAVDQAADELDALADDLEPVQEQGPSASELASMTKKDLYDQAQVLDIVGRSSMTKAELVSALAAE